MRLRYRAARFAAACTLALCQWRADAAGAEGQDLLLSPRYLELYDQNPADFSERERWRVMIHGLRLAALDPRVWGIRESERTENRRLIPMRPFVLRASLDPLFFLESASLRFRFVRASSKDMQRKHHHKDPVLDIFFGGELEMSGHTPTKDRGYFLRLTAFPGFSSGIYYHSLGGIEQVMTLTPELLQTGQEYNVELRGARDQISVFLNGEKTLVLKGNELNRGVMALMTGWHPLKLDQLNVSGYLLGEHGGRDNLSLSGLFKLPLKKKRK